MDELRLSAVPLQTIRAEDPLGRFHMPIRRGNVLLQFQLNSESWALRERAPIVTVVGGSVLITNTPKAGSGNRRRSIVVAEAGEDGEEMRQSGYSVYHHLCHRMWGIANKWSQTQRVNLCEPTRA